MVTVLLSGGCGRILTQWMTENLKVKSQPRNKQSENYKENFDLSPAYIGM